jgi:hypothetical protein
VRVEGEVVRQQADLLGQERPEPRSKGSDDGARVAVPKEAVVRDDGIGAALASGVDDGAAHAHGG